MQYRKVGNTGIDVSILGFGAMRLPQRSLNPEDIDEKLAVSMIRGAIDRGVTYVDTAWGYHKGNSEIVVGKALRDGYRKKVMLATKSPSWLLEKKADFRTFLEKQLSKLATDHIDFYLLHALNEPYYRTILKFYVIEEAVKAKKEGLIGHIGFSFHDTLLLFKTIVESHDVWEFCQIQYNYMDTNFQAGTEGLEFAAARGLGIIVMEPLRGGQLARPPVPAVRAIMEKLPSGPDPVRAALAWVWDRSEVSTALSGMSRPEQVDRNIEIAETARAGALSPEDKSVYGKLREAFRTLRPIPCTACQYCMPCPNEVAIPDILEMYNERVMYNDLNIVGMAYNRFLSKSKRADNCVRCGRCEEACPQRIRIMEWLPRIHEELSAWKG